MAFFEEKIMKKANWMQGFKPWWIISTANKHFFYIVSSISDKKLGKLELSGYFFIEFDSIFVRFTTLLVETKQEKVIKKPFDNFILMLLGPWNTKHFHPKAKIVSCAELESLKKINTKLPFRPTKIDVTVTVTVQCTKTRLQKNPYIIVNLWSKFGIVICDEVKYKFNFFE